MTSGTTTDTNILLFVPSLHRLNKTLDLQSLFGLHVHTLSKNGAHFTFSTAEAIWGVSSGVTADNLREEIA
jgi:hypothetical protein